MSYSEMKSDIEAVVKTKNHVHPDKIKSLVNELRFETWLIPDTTVTVAAAINPQGFMICLGTAGCADPANFNAEYGVKYAIKDAQKKAFDVLWELEGYKLTFSNEG